MNVIITGCAGFLGSHLTKFYLDSGDIVLGVDNFSSSDRNSTHHLSLLKRSNYSFVEADITKLDIVSVKHNFGNVKVDLVLNFACPASPPIYQSIPIETMLTCVVGTKNMLELAQLTGARFVQASTSEVYGDPTVSPQPESYRGEVNSYGPRSCYDEGKRAAEALCFDYFNKKGVDARLVRIFNTYGPQMDPNDGRVVSNFIVQTLQGQPMTIYGDGTQSRSFCYVSDLVRGIVALANCSINPRTPINIGNPNEFSVLYLAELVKRRLGGSIKFNSLPKDDPKQRCPDITLANKLLDWKPNIELNEGLDLSIEYFKSIVACVHAHNT